MTSHWYDPVHSSWVVEDAEALIYDHHLDGNYEPCVPRMMNEQMNLMKEGRKEGGKEERIEGRKEGRKEGRQEREGRKEGMARWIKERYCKLVNE